MYESFFQLDEAPFNLTPDPRFIYLSPGHQEALEHMIYGVEQRKGFVLIAGDIGAGKTTLTRLLLDRLNGKARTALIFNTFLNEIELLRAVNREFGLPAEASGREPLIQSLNAFLVEQMRQGANAVLILDEAQNLSVPVLEQIRMLSNLETDHRKLIQIILVGQPELARTLARPDLAQLNQRVTVRCHLDPLGPEDTMRYILHRLSVAGPRNLARFSAKSMRLVHRFSGGVPRRINALCDRALLAAYARGDQHLAPRYIRQARAEVMGNEAAGRQPRLEGLNRKNILAAVLLVLGLALAAVWGYQIRHGPGP